VSSSLTGPRGRHPRTPWGLSLLFLFLLLLQVSPFALARLKKRTKEKEVAKERKLVPQKVAVPSMQQKTAKGKGRASSVESKEDQSVVEVCPQNVVWDLRLELDGAAIPWNSIIREFQKGHTHYLTKALEPPLLLPKNMVALRNVR